MSDLAQAAATPRLNAVWMNKRFVFVFGSLGLILAACSSGGDAVSGLCNKAKDCARQTNTTFDSMSCVSELNGYRNNAVAKNCGSPFDDLVSCFGAQSCSATDDQLTAACQAKITSLENCAARAGDGGTSSGPVTPPMGNNTDMCTAASKCPNDPPRTQDMIDMCKSNSTMQMTKCPNEAKAFGMCFYNNWTCDASGKTDSFGTIAKCQAEQDALFKCVG